MVISLTINIRTVTRQNLVYFVQCWSGTAH